MDEALDIVVLSFDVPLATAVRGLEQVFMLEPRAAERFVQSLPRAAKRGATPVQAEEYERALRAIGAQVELRPSTSSAPSLGPRASQAPSLQPPPVYETTMDVVARFRASEGLPPLPSEPPPPEVLNPSIPKAPLLPRDLHRLPNGEMPLPSLRPEWMVTDASEMLADTYARPRRHTDAQLPPPLQLDDAQRERRRTNPGHPAPAPAAPSLPSVGVLREGAPSVRPGRSPVSLADLLPSPSSLAAERRHRHVRLALVLLTSVAALALIIPRWTEHRDREARVAEVRRAGIDPGTHEHAREFLQEPAHELVGTDKASALELVSRLEGAGARGVWAARILPIAGSQRARALLVHLPADPTARRSVLLQVRRAEGALGDVDDHGQRWLLLDLR